MNSSKQIKLGAVLSYLSIAVNILAGLIYTPWMISQIGKSDYGLFTLANSLITMFMVDFGLSSATARYVSKYRAEGNEKKISDFLGAIYKLYLIVDAVIFIAFIVVYFLLDDIYVKLTVQEMEKFKIVYIIAALYSLVNFPFVTLNGILTAYEKFVQLKTADLIYRFLVVGLTVGALLFGAGLYAIVTVNAIAGIIIILYKLYIIKSKTSVKVNFGFFNKSLYKEILSFSVWVTVASLAQRLIFNITPTILGIVANSAAIAVFGVITTIEGYTYTITTAINGMFMPRISKINNEGNLGKNIMPLMLKVGKFQYLLNGLIVCGFAVVGKNFMYLWMGPDYIDAYYGVLLVIIPGLFFNSLQIANTAMIVVKKVNLQALIAVLCGLINVVFSFAFSKLFGVIGAATSIFIAYTIRTVLYFVVCKKSLKINIWEFIYKCYFKMLFPMIISVLLGVGLNIFLPDGEGNIINFVFKSVIFVICYSITSYLFALNKEERKKFLSFINSFFKKATN